MSKRLLCAMAVAAVAASTLLFGVGVATATPDLCVAANGEVRHQAGTATCEANGTGSIAIAKGGESIATATERDRNKALAFGDASSAEAIGGTGTKAIATGDGSIALAAAVAGNGNTLIASSDGQHYVRDTGDGNTAIASGDGSGAFAHLGDGNTAIASGQGCFADAGGTEFGDGNGNRAIASGQNSIAFAHEGEGNTATASGDESNADAGLGNGNTATASGDQSIAGAVVGDGNTPPPAPTAVRSSCWRLRTDGHLLAGNEARPGEPASARTGPLVRQRGDRGRPSVGFLVAAPSASTPDHSARTNAYSHSQAVTSLSQPGRISFSSVLRGDHRESSRS